MSRQRLPLVHELDGPVPWAVWIGLMKGSRRLPRSNFLGAGVAASCVSASGFSTADNFVFGAALLGWVVVEASLTGWAAGFTVDKACLVVTGLVVLWAVALLLSAGTGFTVSVEAGFAFGLICTGVAFSCFASEAEF